MARTIGIKTIDKPIKPKDESIKPIEVIKDKK